jgi:hypothetical protein
VALRFVGHINGSSFTRQSTLNSYLRKSKRDTIALWIYRQIL